MQTRVRRVLTLLAIILVSACARGRGAAPRAPALVIFTNESLDQADVFAVQQSGARIRIGTVQGGRTDTLRLGPDAIGATGSISIVARLTPSARAASTGPLTLSSGDRISVRVPIDGRSLVVLPAP